MNKRDLNIIPAPMVQLYERTFYMQDPMTVYNKPCIGSRVTVRDTAMFGKVTAINDDMYTIVLENECTCELSEASLCERIAFATEDVFYSFKNPALNNENTASMLADNGFYVLFSKKLGVFFAELPGKQTSWEL